MNRNWLQVKAPFEGQEAWVAGDLRVIVSIAEHEDGLRWLHVSASRKDRMLSWAEMGDVKDRFVGTTRYAYTVFPPLDRYVNLHPHVWHLYSCCDAEEGKVLPEFSGVLNEIRTI